MQRVQVYDWPTRIFHWSFALSFVGAYGIAQLFDDESATFPYHMLLGLVLVATVLLRVIWGGVGSRYARFSSYRLSPAQLVAYFRGVLSGRGERTLGRNPATSWAALLMMTLALGLGLTGYLMTSGGNKEVYEEVHELLANLFVFTALTHVAGVLLHLARHRDGIALSMVTGTQASTEGASGITRTHWGVGLLFLGLIAGFAFHLNRNYNPGTQTLQLLGSTLQLGESEEHEGNEGGQGENEGQGSDDDDDD